MFNPRKLVPALFGAQVALLRGEADCDVANEVAIPDRLITSVANVRARLGRQLPFVAVFVPFAVNLFQCWRNSRIAVTTASDLHHFATGRDATCAGVT